MVIAYQQTGQVQEARRTAEQFIMVRPNFTIDAWLKTQFRRDTVGLRPIPLPCAPQRFR
ncbi:hypothetical protein [Bradyrhizobium sp.]|uniref:hypothetical protein n=1 Tax=Bradyrhizobium sp. TaxID=376 RepID=UPI0025B980BE|nr:hypothetical protein [Bradyrhizobium sp.]